jgi:hypothetical protein
MGALRAEVGRASLSLGDTGGQTMLPKLGFRGAPRFQRVVAALPLSLADYGRRRFGKSQVVHDKGFALRASTGDTGVYGKLFGKDFGNETGGCIAIDGCGDHKHYKFIRGGRGE